MASVLDELYDSEAFRTLTTENAGDEYKAVMDRLVKAERELKRACERCPDVFAEYQSADMNLHILSNKHEFTTGFRAGARLMLELLIPTEKGRR